MFSLAAAALKTRCLADAVLAAQRPRCGRVTKLDAGTLVLFPAGTVDRQLKEDVVVVVVVAQYAVHQTQN